MFGLAGFEFRKVLTTWRFSYPKVPTWGTGDAGLRVHGETPALLHSLAEHDWVFSSCFPQTSPWPLTGTGATGAGCDAQQGWPRVSGVWVCPVELIPPILLGRRTLPWAAGLSRVFPALSYQPCSHWDCPGATIPEERPSGAGGSELCWQIWYSLKYSNPALG